MLLHHLVARMLCNRCPWLRAVSCSDRVYKRRRESTGYRILPSDYQRDNLLPAFAPDFAAATRLCCCRSRLCCCYQTLLFPQVMMSFKAIPSTSSSDSAVMRSTMTDIFPIEVSTIAPKRLEYPEKYHQLMDSKDVKVFVLYMDSTRKIYYHKRKYADKYVEHVKSVAKESRRFQDFRPNDVNYSTVASRFKRSTTDTHRKNIDTRVGYKMGNSYLVKTYFTFGQRTVAPGQAHVYQVLDVPLLFFLMEDNTKRLKKCLKVKNRLFPYEDLHLYDRRIFLANTVYRVPPGTTYLIFSTQKNFFSVDVVEENTILPYPFVDPVRTRVTKLDEEFSPYDVPAQTPFIGADDHFDEDVYPPKRPAAAVQPYFEWVVFQEQPVPEQTLPEPTEQTLPEQTLPEQPRETEQTLPDAETFEDRQETLEDESDRSMPELEPETPPVQQTPPQHETEVQIVEIRNTVMVASQDFVGEYQRLQKQKIYDDPRKDFQTVDAVGCEQPLDLTMFGTDFLDNFVPDENVQSMIDEILSQPAELSLDSAYMDLSDLMTF